MKNIEPPDMLKASQDRLLKTLSMIKNDFQKNNN